MVLETLVQNFTVTGVITTPPAPKGRHLEVQKNETQMYSELHNIPVYPLENLINIPDLPAPDFIVVAGFGKLIPPAWLSWPKIAAVNLHPSLLPHYRGRFPAEWAILKGESRTGVSLIKMSPEFDKGEIIAQSSLDIEPSDTKITLYQKLFSLGSQLLVTTLPQLAEAKISPVPQPEGKYFYARNLTREDGFVPWEQFLSRIKSRDSQLDRMLRALLPWPGVWTINPEGKRIKLLSLTPPVIQFEGKNPQPL